MMRKGVSSPVTPKAWARTLTVLALLAAGFGCRAPRAVVSPMPADLITLEGHGSWKAMLNGAATKARFSFLLELSGRGQIDVATPLGGTAAEIIFVGPAAYLVFPSERVYWKASPEEVVEKLLGFRLSVADLIGLLCGRWHVSGPGSERPPDEWSFREDRLGRRVSGQRGEFHFSVQDFFPESVVPRRLNFESPLGDGGLTILTMAFNVPVPERLFSLAFLGTYASKSWDEVERILRHEN
jgi:hypothetical protein